jgi:hypothetical protein
VAEEAAEEEAAVAAAAGAGVAGMTAAAGMTAVASYSDPNPGTLLRAVPRVRAPATPLPLLPTSSR